ncbi:MAG: glycosyltransferase family 39 protein [Acidimicrobiales bacterium]
MATSTTRQPSGADIGADDHDDAGPRLSTRLAVLLIGAAVLLGLGIRLYTVLVAYPTCPKPTFYGEQPPAGCFADINWGDSFYYSTQAYYLAEGEGFVNPTAKFLTGATEPGAGHPPVYTTFLAALDKVGLTEVTQHRVVMAVGGALGVALIAGCAWYVAGRRRGPLVGVFAAALAATYPMLWINDFRYLSESIYIPIVAVLIASAYRFHRRPGWGSAVAFGAMIGLAGLTRGEGFMIIAFTLVPLLVGMRQLTWARRAALGATVVGATLVLLVPWVAYNLSRFAEPVTITSGTGMVILHGSCEDAFSGEGYGYYSLTCAKNLPSATTDPSMILEDEADLVARDQASAFLQDNWSRFPGVALARAGRMWDLYEPFDNVLLNESLEGRGYLPSLIGLYFYVALLPLAVYGAVLLHRRRQPLSPILGLMLAVTLTAVISFGITRYRVPADVGLVILAAIALEAVTGWLRRGRSTAVSTGTPADAVAAPGGAVPSGGSSG